MKGTQIFKILGVLITLLVCVSGSYAANPNEVNTSDNVNLQQADQTTTDLGYSADDSSADDSGVDDSGVDDSGVDDSGVDDSYTVDPIYMPLEGIYRTLILEKFAADDITSDDSNADESGSDDTNPSDIYYTLATSELADGNTLLAAGSDESDDSGADDSGADGSDSGSGEAYGNGYDETGIDDGSSDDNGTDDTGIDDGSSDDNGTVEYTYTDDNGVTYVYYKDGSGYATGSGNYSNNATANSTNSIPMQHTGLPILPALLGVLSLVGGFAINKRS
ncbi:MAG: hypothetical protein F8N39_00805 [Clostridiaceae bacterium]|nr:hypothetical protein [Clostridiaceae bacterium]